MLVLPVLVAATPAWAGDKADCRKARREMSVDAWTRYVLDHPGGRCEDEAIGQMLVLSLGRIVGHIAGDPQKVALALAQLARTTPEELEQLQSMFGGLGGGLGGMGALGGLGGGLGSSSLFGALPDDGYGLGEGGIGGLIGGGVEQDDTIYVSYLVDKVDGAWNEAAFWDALDATRPALQSCWQGLGRTPIGIYYVAKFTIADGKLAVESLEQTYSGDGATHDDVQACVRSSLESASFAPDFAGTYAYRVELY